MASHSSGHSIFNLSLQPTQAPLPSETGRFAAPRPAFHECFDVTEYKRLTMAMNPKLDLTCILRPASLTIHLDSDISYQLGPMGNTQSDLPGQPNEHYTTELQRWMRETDLVAAPNKKTSYDSQTQE